MFGAVLAALLIGTVAVLTSCSVKSEPEPEPYKSADEAAKAFSEEVYGSSSYVRHEYATNIYSRTVDGETTYNYTSPYSGDPHSVPIDKLTPLGTTMVAYAHIHPNSNVFSDTDLK